MAFGDLTTLADVKAWLQSGDGTFPDADDALLSRLITATSRFIEAWLKRPIALADWQEVRDGTGGRHLVLANFPVVAVLALSIDGLAIAPAPNDGGWGAGYVATPTGLYLRGYVFTRRPQNVVVTYTAGYPAVPPDIAQACIELVCQRYRERTHIGEVSGAVSGTETISYSQSDMSADVKLMLSQYQAAAPVSGFVSRAATVTDPAILAAAV
ncbi:MAG TPA: hypothetical protein VFX06_11560 [Stellaceae bacterium]|nr:hypothetical protein [Stellaceae bacterium]